MNRQNNISGFTLLELVVVLSIISLVLFFSVPVFKNIQIFSSSNNELARILFLVEKLKKNSVQEDKNMFMHIDLLDQRIWVTNEILEENKENKTVESGFVLSQIRILDVMFSEEMQSNQSNQGSYSNEYQIKFSSRGYSDMVLIHLRDEDENDITIIIEPFLLKAKFEEKYVSFEDCT
ncbi:MAG: prepilin-type N-terminal cleavage/methylation domain-containing protein [Desulfobacteraceae bacterium]|nr:prepilin-type N-terminal cleavage/methylation domain-containing protein [Desulfobacteraceae bacterium]